MNETKYQDEDLIADEGKMKRANELEDRMSQGELTLESLSLEEKQQFADFIKDTSKLEEFLQQWTPWWTIELNSSSLDIKELNKEKPKHLSSKEEKIYTYREEVRGKYEQIPDINKLLKKEPHPSLPFHLINLCYGFVVLARFYNGELKANSDNLVIWWAQASDALLNTKKELPNASIALGACKENLLGMEGATFKFFLDLGLEDLELVLASKFHLFELFYRAYDLVHLAHEKAQSEHENASEEIHQKAMKSNEIKFVKIKQKIIFFLSYCKDKNQDFYNTLKNEVHAVSTKKQHESTINNELEIISKMAPGEIRIK